MERTLSLYFVIASAAIVIGGLVLVQGTLGYLNGLANYNAEMNFCEIHNCVLIPSFNGTQDFLMIGLGLVILCLGLALLLTELPQSLKISTEKSLENMPKSEFLLRISTIVKVQVSKYDTHP